MATGDDSRAGVLLRLLQQEREAELQEVAAARDGVSGTELQRLGIGLARLRVADVGSGLFGRTLVELRTRHGGALPDHKFQPGSVVHVRLGDGASSGVALDGTVSTVTERTIVVAVDEVPDTGVAAGEPAVLSVGANDATYQRERDALRRLEAPPPDAPWLGLARVAAGVQAPRFLPRADPTSGIAPPPCCFRLLNEPQEEAVQHALAAQDVALIHGPPGTGKTTAVVELIARAVARGDRVLAVAPSNVAVDTLAERLLQARAVSPPHGRTSHTAARGGKKGKAAAPGRPLRVVRVGHPARMLPELVAVSLDARVQRARGEGPAAGLRKDLVDVQKQLCSRAAAPGVGDRKALGRQVRDLQKDIRRAESEAVAEALGSADVVLCTLSAAGGYSLSLLARAVAAGKVPGARGPADLGSGRSTASFDLVVVDEAAQATEPACWVALQHGARAVLAGDHRQLGPTLKSAAAADGLLGRTLFDRLSSGPFAAEVCRLLTVQYRMHATIMGWSSAEFYEGRLAAAESVARRGLGARPRSRTDDGEAVDAA